jgi:hypothetical protein
MAALFRLEGRSFDLECLPTPDEFGEAVEQILGVGGWRIDLFDVMARLALGALALGALALGARGHDRGRLQLGLPHAA